MTLGGRRDLHERKLPDEEARNRSGIGSVRWSISLLPQKHEIDQRLSFENGFRPSFWSRGQATFWKSKSPPPRGSPRETEYFDRGSRACRALVQRDEHGSMGSDAKRGHLVD